MDYLTRNGVRIAVADKGLRIDGVREILDLIATVYYEECAGIVLFKENLPEQFFDLKTGFAGEVLQKFSNYRFKFAVVGDFSQYGSKSLKDFIYESNKGKLIFFKIDIDSAVTALSGK